MNSAVSSGEIYVARTGNVVTLALVNIIPSSAITIDKNIGTVPIVPIARTFFVCKDLQGDDVFAFVLEDGNINISGITGAKQGINFYGTVTYVTANV